MNQKIFLLLAGLGLITVILIVGILFKGYPTEVAMQKKNLPTFKDVSKELWDNLAAKKIFFGHQSVGYNILEGVQEIMKENDFIHLNIVETDNPDQFKQPILAHSRVGQNTDPQSKINAFKKVIDAGIGNKADLAFFKFCYVDFNSQTNISSLFSTYKTVLEELEKKYPKTLFLHVSVPLCSPPLEKTDTIKGWIKSWIGRPTVLDENRLRCRYNAGLRENFSSQENLFDLALAESLKPDGTRLSTQQNGEAIHALVPEYTTDGGHLNADGRKKVAEQFLIFLARIAMKPVVSG